jgi:hypothetical protein
LIEIDQKTARSGHRSEMVVRISKLSTIILPITMDVKLVLVVLSLVFSGACLFFGTKNGYYDSDNYHGNGSAH